MTDIKKTMHSISAHKNTPAIMVAFIGAILVFLLTKAWFQNTTSRIIVEGFFPTDTVIEVSSISNNGDAYLFDRFEIKGNQTRTLQRHGTELVNRPTHAIELSFEQANSDSSDALSHDVALTSIQVIKPFQNHYYFNGANIARFFDSVRGDLSNNGTLTFARDSTKASIRSKQAIGQTQWVMILGLTTLFAVGLFLLARNSTWLGLPAFADMSLGNKISSAGEFDTINGLRGLAALLVLLSHTAPGFEAVQMGIAFLFVISGFLLSKPFVFDSSKIFSWANVERYVTKRLKRILPMYYLYVFLIYVVTFKFDTALRHFFFVQAEGHLWPMTQIFAFYMLLPFVLMITSASYRIHRLVPLVLLSIAVYCSVIYMRGWMPFYNGQYSHEFFLYAFLMGVAASYIQYDMLANKGSNVWGHRGAREIVSIIALLITFYIIAWSAPMMPAPEIHYWVSQFWVKCLASVVIILLALNTPNTFYRLLISNWLFRSVGVIGFSFYILHGLGMQIFTQIQSQYLGDLTPGQRGWDFMLGTFCVTYLMALISYSFVERPFFGYRELGYREKR